MVGTHNKIHFHCLTKKLLILYVRTIFAPVLAGTRRLYQDQYTGRSVLCLYVYFWYVKSHLKLQRFDVRTERKQLFNIFSERCDDIDELNEILLTEHLKRSDCQLRTLQYLGTWPDIRPDRFPAIFRSHQWAPVLPKFGNGKLIIKIKYCYSNLHLRCPAREHLGVEIWPAYLHCSAGIRSDPPNHDYIAVHNKLRMKNGQNKRFKRRTFHSFSNIRTI